MPDLASARKLLGRSVGGVRESSAFQRALTARRYARAHGMGRRRYMAARAAQLHLLPPRLGLAGGLFVDVGANEGDWTAALLDAVPDARVICAEPATEPLGVLRARFDGLPNVSVDPRAVSARTGSATLHRTRASVFASLLPPAADLHRRYDLFGDPTEVLETIEVPTVTLDELVGDRLVTAVKLDVQGAELSVIEGGAQTLARARAVLAEVLFVPHYEGDATFGPLHEALSACGFELMDLSPVFRIGDGPALWADAAYARPPA